MSEYHYVYRITNKLLGKHYYGVRTSKLEPHADLGIRYLSSSRDKAFIDDQKKNKDNYRYKVICCFKDRKKAVIFEMKLHSLFDVGRNPNFYNRSKQTASGFDTAGISFESESSRERKRQKWLTDNPNKYRSSCGKNNPMYGTHRTGEENPFYGRSHTEVSRANMSKAKKGRKLTEEWKQKLKEAWKKRTTLTCPWCGLETIHIGNYNRYHGDNCKRRLDSENKK